MVSLTGFLACADQIAAEKPDYQPGHDGSDGKCDCIGYIIGSIRRAGGSWNGTHGSNYAARNEMASLLPVTDPSDLTVGEVVYKTYAPGQPDYSLPDRYAASSDRRDYYHVGIVRSVTPLRIVHCTTPGIVDDKALGRWTHHGWLRGVSRDAQTPTATVTANGGGTVNLRQRPRGKVIARIPVGAAVTLQGGQEVWTQVAHNGRTGWIMDQYLRRDEGGDVL